MRIEKPRRLEIFVVGVVIIGLWFVVAFAVTRARNIKRGEWCQSNLKQVGLAMMQYVRDYDEMFPLARNWSESLYPYSRSKTLFTCPAAPQHGYSLNQTIAAVALSRVTEYEITPLVFESSVLKPFQNDRGKSWLREPRHPQGVGLVYTDGHFEWRKTPPPFPKIKPAPKKLPPIIKKPVPSRR
jgi:hypothetical protein